MSIDQERGMRVLHALENELTSKPSGHRFMAAELAMIDQLHTRGYAATVDLARVAGITADMYVLDIGAGFGGPARYLAETYGCQVEGVDTEPGLVEAAKYLSTRWAGPGDHVTFSVDDARSVAFPAESFNLVWMQHVAMNIADREGLYREIHRVLKPGGRLVTYDVLRSGGDLIYPTPWAPSASSSTVLSVGETRDAMDRAALSVVSVAFDTLAALAWVRTTAAALPTSERPPGALIMRAALGENFREILGNLGKNYLEGRADVAAIIAKRS